MRFDPRRNVFLSDGALDHFAHLAYQDELALYFGRSKDSLAAGDAIALVYCDALVHCLHEHHGTRLFELGADELRRLLLETLPRYVETVATDAPVTLATLETLFRWLERVHRAPLAPDCRALLREPGLVDQLATAIDDPALEAFRPTMSSMSFDETAPEDELG